MQFVVCEVNKRNLEIGSFFYENTSEAALERAVQLSVELRTGGFCDPINEDEIAAIRSELQRDRDVWAIPGVVRVFILDPKLSNN